MSTELRVRFTGVVGGHGELVHRIRNFAEDLQRSLLSSSIGTVENMDTATDTVLVCIRSARALGQASAAANAQLKRHNLLASAVLEH